MKTVLVSAVALVDFDGRVLIAQRPVGKAMAGLWEFPGGKIEPGETPEAALMRELKEELVREVIMLSKDFYGRQVIGKIIERESDLKKRVVAADIIKTETEKHEERIKTMKNASSLLV